MRRKKKKREKEEKECHRRFPLFFFFLFFLASLDVNLPDVLNAKLYELSAIIQVLNFGLPVYGSV